MKKTVYCFIGVIGSGKNYAASMKSRDLGGCKILDPSDGVREYALGFLGIDPDNVHYEYWKKSFITLPLKEDLTKLLTGREYLERMATKLRGYDPFIWANILGERLKKEMETGLPIVVNSVRYPNEASVIIDAAVASAIKPQYNVKFFFCDYKSPRYEIRDHESEMFAQVLKGIGCTHGEDITSTVLTILKNYGL